MKAWITNPWGKPRFLVVWTWLFIVWSIVPIIIAIAFSFNDGRSRTAWQGFSTALVLRRSARLRLGGRRRCAARCGTRSSWRCFAMVIATPLGVALAIGLQRWQSRAGTAANGLMLVPLVTPELVMGASMFILFTQLFTPIGLGTPAQIIGQVTFSISYVVVIVRGRLASIGPEYEEAAADLGAPPREVLRRVLLPLLSPAIVSGLLVVFALSIDDFVVTSYLAKGADTETVPIKIYSAARGTPTPALNALASVMVAVTLASLGPRVLRVQAVGARHGAARRWRAIGGDLDEHERDERPPARDRDRSLTKRFGEVVAVDDITLDIAGGEFFSLVGPSGCGKTTTLRMIAGFERPTRVRSGSTAPTCRRRRRTGGTSTPCSRATRCSRTSTVAENVAFGLR